MRSSPSSFKIAEEKSLKIQSIQYLYLTDTRVHFMTINFVGCEALSRVSLIKSICLQRREFDLIKIIRNILDKYHPRSPFDLTEINGGGFNHASADATLESTTICYVDDVYGATVSSYLYFN